ncbi:MAG: hypothetical protein EOP82_29165 [Variovorax sp.]|nr:MAG: hypothetical protein EOP82_29165 [Variovorax sp.]
MKLSHPRIAILLLAGCAQWSAMAAEGATGTWRCGNTYTDQPCQSGKAVEIDDARNARQRREADPAAREARSAGDRLERERIRLEATQGRHQATLIDNKPVAPPREPGNAVKKKKGKNEADHFSAHDPVATAKNKAEKAAKKSAPKS